MYETLQILAVTFVSDVCAYYVTSSKLICVFPTVSRTQQWDLENYVIAKDILIAGQSIRFVILDDLQPTSICRGHFCTCQNLFSWLFLFHVPAIRALLENQGYK